MNVEYKDDHKKKIVIIAGLFLVLQCCIVASAVPLLPAEFYGTITINDQPASAGVTITAMINDVEKGSFTTSSPGVYGGAGALSPKLSVSGLPEDVDQPIIFFVNGVKAQEMATFKAGTSTELDLTVIAPVRPSPVLTSISPSGSLINNTVPFTIKGNYFWVDGTFVNFTSGSFSNANVTLINVTPTRIDGLLTIGGDVPTGIWGVNVSTTYGKSSLSGLTFKVDKRLKATLSSIAPSSGYAATDVSFIIKGSNFQPGSATTLVTFENKTTGSTLGIVAVYNVSVSQLDGVFEIPSGAPAGIYNVYVTTIDAGKATTPGSFIISKGSYPAPIITSINPSTDYPNATISYTISGSNFVPDKTSVAFLNKTNGIAVNSTTISIVTPTKITGTFVIPYNTPPGPINVNVTTTDGGDALKAGIFTVKAGSYPRPTIGSVTPTKGYRNATIDFVITGTNFQPGQTTIEFLNIGTGIQLNTTKITSITATKVMGTIVIPCYPYTVGPWSVNVTTLDGGVSAKPATFTVDSNPFPKPVVGGVIPVSGYLNSTVGFQVTGSNFQPTLTTVEFVNTSTGVWLNTTVTLTAVTANKITGTIVIPDPAFYAGSYSVNVTTLDGGTALKPGKFTVTTYPTPKINSIFPTSGFKNSTYNFTLMGLYFQDGKTVVDLVEPATGSLINTTLFKVANDKITGSIVIPAGVPSNKYNIRVVTTDGGEAYNNKGLFTISKLPAPEISSITPNTGNKNTTVAFTLKGNNFEPGLTEVSLNASTTGALIDATLVSITPTNIIGSVAIPPDAANGTYRIDVRTADGGFSTKLLPFKVNPMPQPTINSVIPSSGYRNNTIVYTISGKDFEAGSDTTKVMFRNQTSGDYLNTTEVLSVTSNTIKGTITIPSDAIAATYNVYVGTTDGGNVVKPGTFKVNKESFPKPQISKISPGIGYMNTTVAFAITGTNFQPDKTTVAFQNKTTSVLLNTTVVSAVTATTISGSIVIPFGVPTGTYNVYVNTADGNTTITPAIFAVQKMPTPQVITVKTSLTPVKRNNVVNFTIDGQYFEPDLTYVNFTTTNSDKSTFENRNTTIISVTPTRITGNMTVLLDVPAGYWFVNVTTWDGGTGFKKNAIQVV